MAEKQMTIRAEMLKKMYLAGTKGLSLRKEEINDLNVFPVPDGDTGTNMTMTAQAAAEEVERLFGADLTIKQLAKAISGGSLRGARGNSGVILSQLFRGFSNAIKETEEIDAQICAEAMRRAVETAYKAVMKPKEGTILTVAREMAECAAASWESEKDLPAFFAKVLAAGELSLAGTPDLLPVLKEAGVVDSGGKGLLSFLTSAVDAFNGLEIEDYASALPESVKAELPADERIPAEEIRFGYCTEFIVLLEKAFAPEDEREMKEYLSSIGDSLVLVADDEIVKIHVHTNDPGLAIQRALQYGQLTRMKIDNMREEHKERLFRASEYEAARKRDEEEAPLPRSAKALLAVCAGEGLAEIFRDLGVAHVIEGGQTMNPSAEDILQAIKKVNSETVFVLPNNGNILLAAQQAAGMAGDVTVEVIPSKTVPQGIAACVEFLPESPVDLNVKAMTEAIERIQSGEVTHAVRSTKIDGISVKKGDYIGIADAGLIASHKGLQKTVLAMLEKMVDEDAELISIYKGAELDPADAAKLEKAIKKAYPDRELIVSEGGQPVYEIILSVE